MARDEASWARRMQNWTIGREATVYAATHAGWSEHRADAAILTRHGYAVHSSRLTPSGTVLVLYIRRDRLAEYESLGEPGAHAFPTSVTTRVGGRQLVRVASVVLGGAAFLGLYVVLFSGGSPSISAPTACRSAFADAADGQAAGADEYDLDAALRACTSMSEWTAAWREYPPPGAGDDPRFVAENRCMTGGFDSTAICRELGIAP